MVQEVITAHGTLKTPFYMPDATRAGVKGVPMEHVAGTGIEALCMNTYHLMLRPGVEVIHTAGGLHAFSGWHGPILTDSGGYQVFSLIHKDSKLGKITEEGAKFRNVYTGDWIMLTPEESIRVQDALGSDMMVVLDDVRPNDRSYEELDEAVERTLRWAKRAYGEHKRLDSTAKLFAVVQGGPYLDLRQKCLDGLLEIGHWDGFGFGGSHLNAEGTTMKDIVAGVAEMIPDSALKFALGVGTPADIRYFHSVGWDMFDCTLPTRDGRHGKAFLWNRGEIVTDNVGSASNTKSEEPLERGCTCGCSAYSRGYLRHLLQVGDPTVGTVIARHNIHVYATLLRSLKE